MLLVGVAGAVVAVALVFGALWLARSGADVEIRLGDPDFGDLDIHRISAEIADSGPVLFPDVAGGARDLIVQHLGDDPEAGWYAFDARRPGQPRDCFFRWSPAASASPGEAPSDSPGAAGSGAAGSDEGNQPATPEPAGSSPTDDHNSDAPTGQQASEGDTHDGAFVNTCNPDDRVDATGGDLTHYPVIVEGASLRIDINAPADLERTPS